jgi:hypothetical protein
MSKPFYKQCELKQEKTTKVAWIPEKHCQKGHKISIKEDGKWSDTWTVSSVSEESRTNKPPDWRKLIRGHRNATGDSLPKMKRKK